MGQQNCKSKKICIGDLRYLIKLQERALRPPTDVDFREVYTDIADIWASVEIASPKFPFDQINTDEGITHLFFIRYRNDVDLNNWILYDNKRYKILQIRNVNFENKYLELRCNFKGVVSKEGSKW